MKTVYLHIGFDKAASSSIQASIAKNKNYLNSVGYAFPEYGDSANLSLQMYTLFATGSHNHVNNKLRGFHKDKVLKSNAILNSKIDDCIDRSHKVIISGESISLLKRSDLVKCREYFKNKGVRLKVIVFVRNPAKMLVSGASQRIKNSIFLNSKNLLIVRSQFVRNIKSVFDDDASFTLFAEACTHENGPVGKFFSELDLENQNNLVIERRNESPSNLGCRLINYINKFGIYKRDNRNQYNKYIQQTKPMRQLGMEKFKLSKQEILPVLQQLKDENKVIEDLLELNNSFPSIELENYDDQYSEKFYDYSQTTIDEIGEIITNTDPALKVVIKNYYLEHEFISKNISKQIIDTNYGSSDSIDFIV